MDDVDLSELMRFAGELDAGAEATRAGALRLIQGTAALRWQSPAAELFRGRSAELTTQLLHCASGLGATSSELRAHACTVRHRREAVARAAHAAERALAGIGADLAGALT